MLKRFTNGRISRAGAAAGPVALAYVSADADGGGRADDALRQRHGRGRKCRRPAGPGEFDHATELSYVDGWAS